jgi:DNA repair protein RecN (Recombination protein N)
VQVEGRPVRYHARGVDRVEFLLSPNPGESPRPLARVASGGELSRVMLALECVLLGRRRPGGSPSRLVFDEVDAGIGGRVAAAVGERLHRLARERQVLCVTHLPQVASRADHHYEVDKRTQRGRTLTRVRRLDDGGRVREVARMLGGARVTSASRKHAEEMIGRAR